MRFSQGDIIEDVMAYIERRGGECSEWSTWTAKDSGFLRQHGPEIAAGGLIHREARDRDCGAVGRPRIASGARVCNWKHCVCLSLSR